MYVNAILCLSVLECVALNFISKRHFICEYEFYYSKEKVDNRVNSSKKLECLSRFGDSVILQNTYYKHCSISQYIAMCNISHIVLYCSK